MSQHPAQAVAAIPLLVRQHAQDAAFLWVQRSREISGQDFGEVDIGRRDQRLDANIEGLAAAGRLGRATALEEATSLGGAGEHFTLAALALEVGDPAAVTEALDLALAAGPAGERGLSGAVAWTEPARLGEHPRRWLASANPGLRRLGLAALSHHRVDPGRRLSLLLDDPDAVARARAARLAGELGRADALPILLVRLEEGIWPAWSAARLAHPTAGRVLFDRAASLGDGKEAGIALDMALIAGGPAAREALTDLLGRPDTHLLALSRLGVLGERSILPWLVERMRQPETAEAAGFAFRDLFPIDVHDTDLFTSDPSRLGPAFEHLDPAMLPIADRFAAFRTTDPDRPFLSMRAAMLEVLRQGLAAPTRPLGRWRHRRRYPAWV